MAIDATSAIASINSTIDAIDAPAIVGPTAIDATLARESIDATIDALDASAKVATI